MSDCPGGCILAIVGSRDLEGDIRALVLIDALLDQHQPRLVISGGAKGIDQMGVAAARARGIPVKEFIPKVFAWAVPGGFKDRNTDIAQTCECLMRIYSSTTKTYGSGNCHDQAEKLGRNVHKVELVRDVGHDAQSHQNPTVGHVIKTVSLKGAYINGDKVSVSFTHEEE